MQYLKFLICLSFIVYASPSFADTVDVKYRGPVPLDSFDCAPIKPSSFVNGICYDEPKNYLLVLLKQTWYHYCDIDIDTVTEWREAPSLGRYYNKNIRGGIFGCQDKIAPDY